MFLWMYICVYDYGCVGMSRKVRESCYHLVFKQMARRLAVIYSSSLYHIQPMILIYRSFLLAYLLTYSLTFFFSFFLFMHRVCLESSCISGFRTSSLNIHTLKVRTCTCICTYVHFI